jgi:hypothetical protein
MKRLMLIFIFFILGIMFFLTAWRMPIQSLGEIYDHPSCFTHVCKKPLAQNFDWGLI